MANLIEVKVPDIGDFKDVPIVEVLVRPGDRVKTEEPLITLESDKASMDVPSPLDGVVTNLPVRVGETVVPGLQNQNGTTIMTIADMSIITAEVRVDETDIVSVKLGEPADVTIDAIPNRIFKGQVIEIGDTAIVRSSALSMRSRGAR